MVVKSARPESREQISVHGFRTVPRRLFLLRRHDGSWRVWMEWRESGGGGGEGPVWRPRVRERGSVAV